MQPETTTQHDTPTLDPETLLTAGDLARRLQRSSYGVKKAIQRLGIEPERILTGISYYNPAIEETLAKVMRGPNLQTSHR